MRVPAATLAGAVAVLLAGYGYLYSLPMEPIVLLPAGIIALEANGTPLIRMWNVTGIGGRLVGSWSASNRTPFFFGDAGPTRILVPIGTSCGIRFDARLPPGAYVLAWRSGSGTVLTVDAALTVIPSDRIVRTLEPGPDQAALPCAAS